MGNTKENKIKNYTFTICKSSTGYGLHGRVREDQLNREERETGYASYMRVWKEIFSTDILCNNIFDVVDRYEDVEEVISAYDEESDYYDEEYQYYLVGFNSWFMDDDERKRAVESLGCSTLYYIEKLDLYVVGVTHWGTSWDYVMSDCKLKEVKEK